MSAKRSRATYEADLQAQQSPFVVYGTPLPPFDPESRDDGSYVPVWKQEVRDERGRKRLHGAFTGGWSAGYFNTVGSKEGWTPSTFVSSRSSRRKDDKSATEQRPEDFMDDEDIADAEEDRKIQTSDAFAGLGAADGHVASARGLAGLLHVQGETMGTKLLKKMGWREGQGIGPKVRRKADLGMAFRPGPDDTYLFAPENATMVAFVKKVDRKGLCHGGDQRLTPPAPCHLRQLSGDEDEDEGGGRLSLGRPRLSAPGASKRKQDGKARGGIGMGVLNDTGSDDEDPYEMGPRISYNKVIGGGKTKKKKKELGATTAANPALKSKPVFLPKRTGSMLGTRKCHDGRPPLEGFVLSQNVDPLVSTINIDGKYPPPQIPTGWKSSKKPETTLSTSQYVSTADAAKASQMDPRARATLLGEKQLPGKSVFDFLSPAARDRLAAATGKGNMPQAKGEIPEGYSLSEEEKRRSLLDRIPKLDKQSALAAITRGAAGGAPYGDDEDKRARYRSYLELQAGLRSEPPDRPSRMTKEGWLQEMEEFYNVGRIFRPMTGSMASRFTTTSSSSLSMASGSDGRVPDGELMSKSTSKPEDPAEAAAKMGMFGHMTRSVKEFYPSRVLCKRFNVKPPSHVHAEGEAKMKSTHRPESAQETIGPEDERISHAVGYEASGSGEKQEDVLVVVDTGRNEALEGKRAGEEVFKAIFGASSDEEN